MIKSCGNCTGECCVKVSIKVPTNMTLTRENLMLFSRRELEELGCDILWDENKSKARALVN